MLLLKLSVHIIYSFFKSCLTAEFQVKDYITYDSTKQTASLLNMVIFVVLPLIKAIKSIDDYYYYYFFKFVILRFTL